MFTDYQRAEDEATRRALQGEACAVWQTGASFTVHPCGQDHQGMIVYMIIPID